MPPLVLLACFAGTVLLSAQGPQLIALEQRRSEAYATAIIVDQEDPAQTRAEVRCLEAALEDPDETVRAFAARALERVARRPAGESSSEEDVMRVRSRLSAVLTRESSPFVRPWILRGLGSRRPGLEERLQLLKKSFSPTGGVRQPFDDLDLLIEGSATGDENAERELLRLDSTWKGLMLEWVTKIEEAFSATRGSTAAESLERQDLLGMPASRGWRSLTQVYGVEEYEDLPLPSVHHPGSESLGLAVSLGKAAVPALVDALVHGNPKTASEAHRVLKALGAEAELAAPFVIRRWSRGRRDPIFAWFGHRATLYDAIAGCSDETIRLVVSAYEDDDPKMRRAAVEAMPRFGGRAARPSRETLIRALDDRDGRVSRAAAASLHEFYPDLEGLAQGVRLRIQRHLAEKR